MQHCPMQVGGGDAFIELEKLLGLVGISFRTAHPRRHRATSPVVLVIACEEQSDEAIQKSLYAAMDCFASLAMTIPTLVLLRPRARRRSCAARYIAVRRRRPSQSPGSQRRLRLAGWALPLR